MEIDKKIIKPAIIIILSISMIPLVVAVVNQVIPDVLGGTLVLIGLITFIFVAGIIMFMVKTMSED